MEGTIKTARTISSRGLVALAGASPPPWVVKVLCKVVTDIKLTKIVGVYYSVYVVITMQTS